MIKCILSNPLNERIWDGVPNYCQKRREYEVLVLLECDVEATVWIPETEIHSFYSMYPHGRDSTK